jgi:ribosome-dependent ATPase
MAEMNRRFVSGDVQLVIEIPSGFGRDLLNGREPELGAWIDGSMPFRAETIRGYVTGLLTQSGQELATRAGQVAVNLPQVEIGTRFRYNQAFKSVNAMVPSVIMLMLILIPAIMSAVAVVREKETGSIANFHATPTTKFEYLAGKQLPYIAIAMVSFIVLALLAVFLFGVPIKGSAVLLIVGTLLYVTATTGFGQLVSTFTRTQVAAVFATAILTIIPTINFSGLLVPVSSLSGGARLFGLGFPASWYQQVSSGVFAKGLGFGTLWLNVVMLALFAVVFLIAAQLLLRKQER